MKDTVAIRKAIIGWFQKEARDLPWRKTRDPYAIWLSEIMLQQTRVDQGLPYYNRFLAALPTVQSLADAPLDTVLKLWEGLGYYTRARNLHKAAGIILEQYSGEIPRKADVLQMLPGIGRYTAGAIASIAYDERTPVLDGNVKRVLSRLYNVENPIDEAETERDLWGIADQLTPANLPGDFNQGMMELGARICTPKKPNCDVCPVLKHCSARRLGLQEARPLRRARKPVPHKEIVVAAILHEGKYLLGKRPENGLLGGLWELPGGKLEAGETHQQALQRECREELNIEVEVGGLVATVKHAYTHFKVTLNVYRCRILHGEPQPRTHTELRWVAPAQFKTYTFPKANHKFLPLLEA